ncbi:MAG TPA: response regulator transcription factor [Candidatus Acidoferrales bacterium]|nr:response regulator transcription factor [Candidatus Acidoferrales bacterium]
MIRALIADDHAVVRRGLIELLKEEIPDIEFSEAGTSEEALTLLKKHNWAIVILDISMPGTSGLDILADLKEVRPNVPVLFLSVHPEEQFAKRAIQAGAAGYLTKESVPAELVKAVRKVLSGGRYISEELTDRLARELGHRSWPAGHESLSPREFQILRMLASGMGSTEIAKELAISVKTVSTYRARILLKLNLRSTADLIRYAINHNLAD